MLGAHRRGGAFGFQLGFGSLVGEHIGKVVHRRTGGRPHAADGFVEVQAARFGFVDARPAEALGDVLVCLVGVGDNLAILCELTDRSHLKCHTGALHIWFQAHIVAVGHCHGKIHRTFPALRNRRCQNVEHHGAAATDGLVATNIFVVEQVDENGFLNRRTLALAHHALLHGNVGIYRNIHQRIFEFRQIPDVFVEIGCIEALEGAEHRRRCSIRLYEIVILATLVGVGGVAGKHWHRCRVVGGITHLVDIPVG